MFELYNYLNKLKDYKEYELLNIFSKNSINTAYIKEFIDALINSLYTKFPTCRYNETRKDFINTQDYKLITPDQLSFYKDNDINNPRFPSNCDQIIFIMKNIKYNIKTNNINIIDLSIKSDHLAIYRQVELNISNINFLIPFLNLFYF